ncbi:hypothetical protein DAEQUDRAFT_15006 [Daedalea quercina L-15889]|uniref:Protein kinase domain-containing protein n=1 Tax=Daedalea quercina L-15889 TaxID=1314783 RepID=A0A165UIN2_9APHY|nr:hypothetical protein DAEQUDRAFT_15006 [Daedalea quercina L-15889]
MPMDVALRWATGMQCIDRLLKEAHFYENQLKGLQGSAVPKFYGFYVGRTDDIDIGCLLVEWCGGEPHPDLWERKYVTRCRRRLQQYHDCVAESVLSFSRQMLLVAARIHAMRVCHGRLSDGRHFVASSKDNTMRIVNFSHASVHSCPGGTPLLLNPDGSEDAPERCSRCPELALLEETYGPDTGMDAYRLRQANGLEYRWPNASGELDL